MDFHKLAKERAYQELSLLVERTTSSPATDEQKQACRAFADEWLTAIASSMATGNPYCCPVCNGAGTVSRPPHVAGDVIAWSSNNTAAWPCNACKGAGVIWRS